MGALVSPSELFESKPYYFDLHSHPGAFFYRGSGEYGGDEGVHKTFFEMNAGGISGVFVSLVGDMPLLQKTATGIKPVKAYAKGEGKAEYQKQMGIIKSLLAKEPVQLATKKTSINGKSSKVAVYLSCEGGDVLEGSTDLLDQMYDDGIRSLQPMHYAPNPLGDVQTEAPQFSGLSAVGKEVIKKCNRLGILIDMAHASFDTVKDTAAITTAPLMLSHSILQVAEERPIGKRAISIEHAKLIASTGGVVGAWPSGFNTSFEDYVINIKRLIDAIGIDHVGIGTDMDSNFKPVLNSYLQYPTLAAALENKGFTKEEVRKVMGENAKRIVGSY